MISPCVGRPIHGPRRNRTESPMQQLQAFSKVHRATSGNAGPKWRAFEDEAGFNLPACRAIAGSDDPLALSPQNIPQLRCEGHSPLLNRAIRLSSASFQNNNQSSIDNPDRKF